MKRVQQSKRQMELESGRAADWIVGQLLVHPGVEERRSRFADKEALFFRGTEFFHFDEPGLADVRPSDHSRTYWGASLRSSDRASGEFV